MKKLISIVLLLAMTLSLLAGCTIAPVDNGEGLEEAKKFIINYFQGSKETTDVDYTVIGYVPINDVKYNITWTTDNENVKVTPQDNGMVLIDVPELTSEAVTYTLTATISDGKGNSVTYSVTRKISASAGVGKTNEEIVNEAFALPSYTTYDSTTGQYKDADGNVIEGAAMEGITLTATVKRIRLPYDDGYKNITVVVQVGNLSDKEIDCYRLKGEGVGDLAPGDTVTIQGTLENRKGTVQFASGAVATKIVKGPTVSCPATAAEILAAAQKLEQGWALPYKATLIGVVTEVITPSGTDGYTSATCNISVNGTTVQCYRMDGADTSLAVGDTITVTGYLMNFKGTIEFSQGCTMDSRVPGEGGSTEEPSTPANWGVIETPVVGTAYKFGMIQGNLNETYYLAGGMGGYNNYYLATTTNASTAIDVYLEETTGGYYLYCYVGDVKTYINMVPTSDGAHVNGAYETTASTVYTYDATLKTLTAAVNNDVYVFGTQNNNTYNTVGAIKSSYNPFVCNFFGEESGSTACAHEGGTATCTEKAVCDLCGEVYGNLADHNYVDGSCSACGATEPQGPVADTLITLEEAKTLGLAQEHNTYTADKYYVEGIITEVYNTSYGNMYIKNDAGTIFTIYGLYSDGTRYDAMTSKPVAGDKIKVYGAVGQYSGTAQIKNGDLVEFEVLHTCSYSTATCTVAPTCACGATNGEALGHKDENTDHVCDNGCSVAQGTHADGDDEDLLCDYGCGVEITGNTETGYVKINSASQFTSGTYVMIVSTGYAPTTISSANSPWVDCTTPVVDGDVVIDTKDAVWTITVNGTSVTLTDANGKTIAPKGGNSNGIKTASYNWDWVCNEDGTFSFKGVGTDTVILASNHTTGDNGGFDRFRGYKTTTVAGDSANYFAAFTLYKLVEG